LPACFAADLVAFAVLVPIPPELGADPLATHFGQHIRDRRRTDFIDTFEGRGDQAGTQSGRNRLERRQLSEAMLNSSRQRLDDISADLRKISDEFSPRAEALRSRLKELGPEPDAKSTPESPEIAKERADRDKGLKELDELLKLTRSASLQTSQLIDTIIEKRREAFQRHLFERTASILAPGLWVDVVMGLPKDMMAFVILTTDTMALILQQRGIFGLGLMAAGLFGLFGVLLVTPRFAQILLPRVFPNSNPKPFAKPCGQ